MVKLPKKEDITECDSVVMFYYNNRRVYTHGGPIELTDLEQIAAMAVNYSDIGALTTYSYVKQMAINRVRQLFNLVTLKPSIQMFLFSYEARSVGVDRLKTKTAFNQQEFKMVCNYCGIAHYQDEITAPER